MKRQPTIEQRIRNLPGAEREQLNQMLHCLHMMAVHAGTLDSRSRREGAREAEWLAGLATAYAKVKRDEGPA